MSEAPNPEAGRLTGHSGSGQDGAGGWGCRAGFGLGPQAVRDARVRALDQAGKMQNPQGHPGQGQHAENIGQERAALCVKNMGNVTCHGETSISMIVLGVFFVNVLFSFFAGQRKNFLRTFANKRRKS